MAISIMTLVVTTTAFAQDSQLRRLTTGDDAKAWEAVGRLNIGGTGFCTGALIAPNMVLTAAHCLFDKETGAQIDHAQVEFLAGWRDGRASAYRYVKQVVVHPDYKYIRHVSTDGVGNDLYTVIINYHEVRITFDDLPPGRYAIKLYHDANGNGELDTNMMGLPIEAYGFSGESAHVGPPPFDVAAFDVVVGENNAVTVRLR